MPRVVIVSNRLPVSVKKVDGKLEFYPSAGGLATGLSSYANTGANRWIGWPGIASDDLSDTERKDIATRAESTIATPYSNSNEKVEGHDTAATMRI
jgi:trehalose 6-phosphate synthase/phosphatase